MLVKVKDIQANPYRNIDKYPIDREKVETLKQTIQKTGFWDNILLRKSPTNNHYEQAYGHHRLVAVRELGIKEIDVPVKDISDIAMIQIMADENFGWGVTPAIAFETVRAAKRFIDTEVAKYERWEDVRSQGILGTIFETLGINSGQAFAKLKSGAGEETVKRFLGDNWSLWTVRQALSTVGGIESGELSEKAFESLPSLEHASKLRAATNTYGLDKKQQERVAKVIVEKGVGKRDVDSVVRQTIKQPPKEIPDEEIARLISEVESMLESVDKQARALANKITGLNVRLEKLDVQQIKGLQAMFLKGAFADLLTAAKQLLGIVGVKGI